MRSILLLLALTTILFTSALATQMDWQENKAPYIGTFNSSPAPINSYSYWVRGGAGGNGYACTYMDSGSTAERMAGIALKNPVAMQYAAGTFIYRSSSGYNGGILLLDSSKNVLTTLGGQDFDVGLMPTDSRYEVTVTGTTVKLYRNGILIQTASTSKNPEYIAFGTSNRDKTAGTSGPVTMCWDNLVWGTSEDRNIIGFPEESINYIGKDMNNPSANGFYYEDNSTLISSTVFPSTWGISNVSLDYEGPVINQSVYLKAFDSDDIYLTSYTYGNNVGTINWNLTAFFDQNPPYGYYYAIFQNRTGTTSSGVILYKSSGAVVSFDAKEYAQNDLATITYAIDGAYWDTSVNDYYVKVIDAWGTEYESQHLTEHTGYVTHRFSSDEDEGTYYAVVIAVVRSTSETYWLDADYAELEAYFNMYGYVNDAETELPISGANVTITQGSTSTITITATDGNYTFGGGLLGTELTINATATGYFQYLAQFVPATYGTTYINITLNSTTPSYTGLGIGGVARDGIFDGTTITSGYGRPIEGATVMLVNTTNGESYSKTTNMAGWYLCDEGTSCFLTTGRPYDVWGEKLGYSNSPNYTAVAA